MNIGSFGLYKRFINSAICDWKSLLSGYGFGGFNEHQYLKNYIRLLQSVKL